MTLTSFERLLVEFSMYMTNVHVVCLIYFLSVPQRLLNRHMSSQYLDDRYATAIADIEMKA